MPACIRHVFSVSRSAKRTHKSTTVRTGCIVISLMAIVLLGCALDRHVRVTKEMAWECLPAERDARYPEAEPVMFRYTEDPEYYDLASGRGLCQQLRVSGVHPGEMLREEFMKPLGISINGLALELHVPVTRISQIVNERRGITADTALRLARHFGTSADFWMNIEKDYELLLTRRKSLKTIERQVRRRTVAA